VLKVPDHPTLHQDNANPLREQASEIELGLGFKTVRQVRIRVRGAVIQGRVRIKL